MINSGILRNWIRRLRRAPGINVTAVLMIAFGIAIATSTYSVIDALFRAPAIRDVHQVLQITRVGPGLSLTHHEYEQISAAQRSFTEMAAWSRAWDVLGITGSVAERLPGELVDGSYFQLVGAQPQRGRLLIAADDLHGAEDVVVLSYAIWRRVFRSDPNIVGRNIRLSGLPVEVVGVVAPPFNGVALPTVSPTAFWVPLRFARKMRTEIALRDATGGSLRLLGRLKQQVTIGQARQEMALLAEQLDQSDPAAPAEYPQNYQLVRTFQLRELDSPANIQLMNTNGLRLGQVAIISVSIVFCISLSNVAILLWSSRRRQSEEIAIRVALGASWRNVIRQEMVEVSAIVCVGSVLGFSLGHAMCALWTGQIREWPAFTEDVFVYQSTAAVLIAIAVSCFVLATVTLAAVARDYRRPIRLGLGGGSTILGRTTWRKEYVLIASQVAVAFIFVGLSAVCVRQMSLAGTPDTGVDLERLAIIKLDFRTQEIALKDARHHFDSVLRVIANLPGVRHASLMSGLPIGSTANFTARVRPLDQPFLGDYRDADQAVQVIGSNGLLTTLGISLHQGRMFDARDIKGSETVGLINQQGARRMFGTTDAVGKQISYEPLTWVGEERVPPRRLRIVGVTDDTDVLNVGERDRVVLYLPYAQHEERVMLVVARGEIEPEVLVKTMRLATGLHNPDLAVFGSGTGVSFALGENLFLTYAAWISIVLGFMSVVLAMIGMSALLVGVVRCRTQEIGLRLALGASKGHVVNWVMRHGTTPVLAGSIIGGAVCTLGLSALKPFFVQFGPAVTPLVFAILPFPFLAVAAMACYWPAKRATGVEPRVALLSDRG